MSSLTSNNINTSNRARLLSVEDVDYLAKFAPLEQFRDKKLLFTGATGLVGSYFLESLCFGFTKLGFSPKEIRIFSGGLNFSHLQHLKEFKYLKFHATPLIEIQQMHDYDILIHAASPASPTKYPSLKELLEINAGILERIMMPGMQKVLFISAGEVYGPKAISPIAETTLCDVDYDHSRSAYPTAKVEAERMVKELGEKFAIQTNSVRLFHTFGPGITRSDGRSFADFIWNAVSGKKPMLKSSGEDLRTFLYLRDTTTGFLNILEHGIPNEIYNLGGSNPISILSFARRVSELAGLHGDVEFSEKDSSYVPSPNHKIFPNVSKLEGLGWKQEIDLDETILRTMHWAKRQS